MIVRPLEAMGTVFNFFVDAVDAVDASEESLQHAIDEGAKTIAEVEARFSTWIQDSELSRFRRGEIQEPSDDFDEVMLLSYRALEVTGGYFDPWTLDGGYDPTGLVKGWAIGKALETLASCGVESGGINGGGDVALLPGWKQEVGVQHPRNREAICAVLEVESAVATSGIYERGAHITNPLGDEIAAVSGTVVGEELWLCDAFATALVAGGEEVLFLIERYPNYEGFFINQNDALIKTSGLILLDSST